MPRRLANVNLNDVRRVIRACKQERTPFRITLQPNGAAVFETGALELAPETAADDQQDDLSATRKNINQLASSSSKGDDS